MNSLFKNDVLGGPSDLSLGLGHGSNLDDGIGNTFHGMSGQGPPQPSQHTIHPTSTFQFERDRRDKNHNLVRATTAIPPGMQPTLSIVFSKSKPNVVIFPGDTPSSGTIFGEGDFSKLSTNHKLSLRGMPIDFHGDEGGNYVFEASSMGRFTWQLDEMSGNLQSLHDAAGVQVARFRGEGMLSGVKTLEVLVDASIAILEFIIFSAAVTRIYEKETVRQMKKGGKIMDAMSAIVGS